MRLWDLDSGRRLLHHDEVAERLGWQSSTLRASLGRGTAPAATHHLRRTPLWSAESVEAWMAERGRSTDPAAQPDGAELLRLADACFLTLAAAARARIGAGTHDDEELLREIHERGAQWPKEGFGDEAMP